MGHVHYLLHEEDPQLLGAVGVLAPAELPEGVLVVTDKSPDDGMGFAIIFSMRSLLINSRIRIQAILTFSPLSSQKR